MSKLTGTVKWYSAEKGYGFIAPDTPIPGVDRDLFMHNRELGGAVPHEDQRVSFDVGEHRGRKHATGVTLLR